MSKIKAQQRNKTIAYLDSGRLDHRIALGGAGGVNYLCRRHPVHVVRLYHRRLDDGGLQGAPAGRRYQVDNVR